ncbi:hypothetical protein WJ438_40555 [Streptomyces sp. GD-15H]|uniref:hypothetical protein n=1 Tax=Streptomyces sp. GD-15H TaxID=3129112 RepID=UPI0032564A31
MRRIHAHRAPDPRCSRRKLPLPRLRLRLRLRLFEPSRAGGRSARAAELAVQVAEARQRERQLEQLRAFVRETVMARTHPNTTAHRLLLEALGEAGGLWNAQTVELSTEDVILCTRKAGHYAPAGYDPLGEKESEGWHKCNGRTWIVDRPCNHPRTAA